MAQIREELTLADKFSGTFMNFINKVDSVLLKLNGVKTEVKSTEDVTEELAKSAETMVAGFDNIDEAEAALLRYQSTVSKMENQMENLTMQMEAQDSAIRTMAQNGETGSTAYRKIASDAERTSAKLLVLDQEIDQYKAKIFSLTSAINQYQQANARAENSIESFGDAENEAGAAQERHISILQRFGSAIKTATNGVGKFVQSALEVKKASPSFDGLMKQVRRFALTIFSVQKIINAVKNALERAPDSISKSFTDAGKNLQDVFGGAVVSMLSKMQPAIDRFNAFLQSPQGSRMISKLSKAFEMLGEAAGTAIDMLVTGAEFVADNWDVIAPILISAAIAIGVAMTASAVSSMIAWISATWPLLLVVAIIAGIILIAHKMGASFEEIFNFIGQWAGGLYVYIYNLIAETWNYIASFAEFFANVFNDPATAIKNLFFDVFDVILGLIENVAGAFDAFLGKIFGISISDSIKNFRANVNSLVDKNIPENQVKIDRMNQITYEDTMEQWGNAAGSFGAKLDELEQNGGLFSSLSDIQNTLKSTDEDTSAIRKSVALSEEDLKSLVDMAERQYINNINFTAQTPVITVNGANTGNTAADRRSLADQIRDVLMEQRAAAAVVSTARVW